MIADVTVATEVYSTPRIIQAGAMFDVPPLQRAERSWAVDLPLEEKPWSVGLIVGPSGAGKSSVARACFGEILEPAWDPNASILDAFPARMGIREIVSLLTAVGFGSPPAWMRAYQTLSTGEQFRVSCARRLAEASVEGIICIDEFTSTVDRQVAQVASHALAKYVRRVDRRLVAVTCHYDVVDWLQPDWIYQPHVEAFAWRSVQPRPSLDVDIYPLHRSSWRVFSQHHYLSAEHLRGAKCFGLFIGDECVAYHSYRHFMHPVIKNMKIGHRLVVLPDWQGLGLGAVFVDWMGQYLYDQGWRYRLVTAHPAVIASLVRSPRWQAVTKLATINRPTGAVTMRKTQMDPRRQSTRSFEYVPPLPLATGGIVTGPTVSLRAGQ